MIRKRREEKSIVFVNMCKKHKNGNFHGKRKKNARKKNERLKKNKNKKIRKRKVCANV